MNIEREMSTSDGLGGDPGPFRVVPRPYGFAVVNSDSGGILWAGQRRDFAEKLARARNREAAAYDRAKLDPYNHAHGLDR